MHGIKPETYQFFAGEDLIVHEIYIQRNKGWTHINGDEMNLRMAMLSGLRGRHVHNLAGAA